MENSSRAERFERLNSQEPVVINRLGKKTATKMTGKDRTLVRLIALAAFLVVLLVAFVITRSAFFRAEEDYAAKNNASISITESGDVVVSGFSNGVPFEYVEDGRIISGVSVAGVDLSGMNYDEARRALLDDINERIAGINIRASVENTTLVLTAADFRVSADVNQLIYDALKLGRDDNVSFYENYLLRKTIESEGRDLGDYELKMDEESMRDIVAKVADLVDKAPVEPYTTLLNLVGGGKPGVGIGGPTSDLYTTKKIYAPDGVAMAEIQFHNGMNGYVLNQEDMLQKISAAFYSGDHNAELSLMLEETEPTYTAEQLAESLVEISRFSTKFSSSGDYRARNVQKAAGLLHCTVLEPGVDYSYNEMLGPRYEKDGWLPAPGISGGKEYIDSPGGGICQVSSTLYNSLLKLGPDIEIVRRYHHSIPGSYVAMGLDATVSYGGPDLVWRNVSDSPLLLFSYADMKNKTVYEIIYGVPASDGCTYKIWSETVEEIAPPDPKRVEEPLWPTGYSKYVISPRKGYNVNVYRQKYDADGNKVGDAELLYQDKYAAVQGELHYGTGDASLPKP